MVWGKIVLWGVDTKLYAPSGQHRLWGVKRTHAESTSLRGVQGCHNVGRSAHAVPSLSARSVFSDVATGEVWEGGPVCLGAYP